MYLMSGQILLAIVLKYFSYTLDAISFCISEGYDYHKPKKGGGTAPSEMETSGKLINDIVTRSKRNICTGFG